MVAEAKPRFPPRICADPCTGTVDLQVAYLQALTLFTRLPPLYPRPFAQGEGLADNHPKACLRSLLGEVDTESDPETARCSQGKNRAVKTEPLKWIEI